MIAGSAERSADLTALDEWLTRVRRDNSAAVLPDDTFRLMIGDALRLLRAGVDVEDIKDRLGEQYGMWCG